MKYIIDGKVFYPIKVGDKKDGRRTLCPECRMAEGEFHYGYCILETCPRCKKKLFINCKCKSWIPVEDNMSDEECKMICKQQLKDIKHSTK